MRDVLAIVCHEFDVLGDNVLMPWIVEEVAGAVCGVDNQLAVSQLAHLSSRRQRIFTTLGITILYFYTKPNPDPNANPIKF